MNRAAKIGGGCILLVSCLCLATFLLAPVALRLAMLDPDAAVRDSPLSIEGACTRDEVVAYLGETGPRFEKLFDGLEALSQSGSGGSNLSAVDVVALRASRDELAAHQLAPCLSALRDEEVALADVVIDQVANLQVAGTPSALRSGAALLGLMRGVRPRVARMQDARERLEERYGISSASGTDTPVPLAPLAAPAYP